MAHHSTNPADYGWQFQGSNAQSRVEYWAKDNTRMDYFPTTASASAHPPPAALLPAALLPAACGKVGTHPLS
jgi:hypothetical protein